MTLKEENKYLLKGNLKAVMLKKERKKEEDEEEEEEDKEEEKEEYKTIMSWKEKRISFIISTIQQVLHCEDGLSLDLVTKSKVTLDLCVAKHKRCQVSCALQYFELE